MVLHPDFEENNQLYFSYVVGNSDNRYALAVSKAVLENDKLTDVKRIFIALPYGKSKSNFGGG